MISKSLRVGSLRPWAWTPDRETLTPTGRSPAENIYVYVPFLSRNSGVIGDRQTLIFSSFLFGKKRPGKPPKRKGIFLGRTPKITGKERENTQKSKDFLAKEKSEEIQKKAKEDQGVFWVGCGVRIVGTLDKGKIRTTPSFALAMLIVDFLGVVRGFRGLMLLPSHQNLEKQR